MECIRSKEYEGVGRGTTGALIILAALVFCGDYNVGCVKKITDVGNVIKMTLKCF